MRDESERAAVAGRTIGAFSPRIDRAGAPRALRARSSGRAARVIDV
tara:strand:+ start:622 stop:759 length:138 start_codon:yes stop_codon:yes gene_type:complete